MGNYQFAPALTVDETRVDRTLYKLIFLTRHAVGMRVFRDAYLHALEIQATYRSAKKAASRKRQTGMDDVFSPTLAMEPQDAVVVPAWPSKRIKRPKDDFRFHLPAR